MRSPLRPARTSVLTAVTVALALALAPTTAGAHVELIESEPAAGETVREGLGAVQLTLAGFDPEARLSVEVTDPDGEDVSLGEPRVDARTATVEVPVQPLEVGEHIVHWRAVAEDDDGPSEGTFSFEVEEAQGGGWGIWLVWLFALGIPAAIFLRPGARRTR